MTVNRRTMACRLRIPGNRNLIGISLLFLLWGCIGSATAQTTSHQVHSFKVTVLSTMLVGDAPGIGEWGFAALVDADGHRILVDTGAHPDTVLRNARDLHIDLSDVKEVVLTHYHWDHVRGLLALRRELMKENPQALSIAHVSEGIFDSRPSETGEGNEMIAIRKEFEATGGKFIVHSSGAELISGAWLTGPVPRVYPEHNWSGTGKVLTTSGLVEDNVPEDTSLVIDTPKGLVIITGCGHAGIVNIVTFAENTSPTHPSTASLAVCISSPPLMSRLTGLRPNCGSFTWQICWELIAPASKPPIGYDKTSALIAERRW